MPLRVTHRHHGRGSRPDYPQRARQLHALNICIHPANEKRRVYVGKRSARCLRVLCSSVQWLSGRPNKRGNSATAPQRCTAVFSDLRVRDSVCVYFYMKPRERGQARPTYGKITRCGAPYARTDKTCVTSGPQWPNQKPGSVITITQTSSRKFAPCALCVASLGALDALAWALPAAVEQRKKWRASRPRKCHSSSWERIS